MRIGLGSWQDCSSHNSVSSHSCTGYIITYAGCPIVWGSKLQTLIARSTTKAECIALSSALHEVIAIGNLLMEMKEHEFPIHASMPQI